MSIVYKPGCTACFRYVLPTSSWPASVARLAQPPKLVRPSMIALSGIASVSRQCMQERMQQCCDLCLHFRQVPTNLAMHFACCLVHRSNLSSCWCAAAAPAQHTTVCASFCARPCSMSCTSRPLLRASMRFPRSVLSRATSTYQAWACLTQTSSWCCQKLVSSCTVLLT